MLLAADFGVVLNVGEVGTDLDRVPVLHNIAVIPFANVGGHADADFGLAGRMPQELPPLTQRHQREHGDLCGLSCRPPVLSEQRIEDLTVDALLQ
jgi:hypothetical protein